MKIFISLSNVLASFMASPNYPPALNHFVSSDRRSKQWRPYIETWSRVEKAVNNKDIVLHERMGLEKDLCTEFESRYGNLLKKVESTTEAKKDYHFDLKAKTLTVTIYAPDIGLTKQSLTKLAEKWAQAFGPAFKELDLIKKSGILTLNI